MLTVRFAALTCACLLTPRLALAADDTKLAKSDATFIEKTARNGLLEVEAAKVALAKSQTTTVKELAQQMVDAHTQLRDELGKLASQKGVIMPSALNAAQKKAVATLNETSAPKLDAAFIRAMIDDHEKAIANFENAAQSARDTELRDWVTATLPKLKLLLETANKLKA